jgi:hypothetical protein
VVRSLQHAAVAYVLAGGLSSMWPPNFWRMAESIFTAKV